MATKDKQDVGQAEVQSVRDKAREQGYEGYSPSPVPNSEFSLATGPDSPSAGELTALGLEQRVKDVRASLKGGA